MRDEPGEEVNALLNNQHSLLKNKFVKVARDVGKSQISATRVFFLVMHILFVTISQDFVFCTLVLYCYDFLLSLP